MKHSNSKEFRHTDGTQEKLVCFTGNENTLYFQLNNGIDNVHEWRKYIQVVKHNEAHKSTFLKHKIIHKTSVTRWSFGFDPRVIES